METHSSGEVPGESEKRPPSGYAALRRLSSPASTVLDPEVGAGGGAEAESRKLPSSQFKGVVPQPNGRWGAQIYEKHQRVWLGTFNEEDEAAWTYDVAAQRFRGRDAATNFEPLAEAEADGTSELAFLAAHSKAEIVDMLRKHTYRDELLQSRRCCCCRGRGSACASSPLAGSGGGGSRRENLFEKAVTPSDVGKLNRLVIPKQHAEKHFPLQQRSAATAAVACKGMLLNFMDADGKVWRFRYSYWNSSQSYVLTKGWSRFVKEKGLRAGDVVSFQGSAAPEKQLFIGWRKRSSASAVGRCGATDPAIETLRLFGVNIVRIPASAASAASAASSGNGGAAGWKTKRAREMDEVMVSSSSMELLRKQCRSRGFAASAV